MGISFPRIPQKIAYTIVLILSVTIVVSYVVEPLLAIEKEILRWGVVIGNVAVFYALTRTILTHSGRIINRKHEWDLSIVVIVSLFATLAVGLLTGIKSPMYNWIWDTIFNHINLTIRSLLFFFAIYAFYKSFLVKNSEALLLVIASIFVLLKNAPIGEFISPELPKVGDWFLSVLSMAGMRGIMITAGIGAVIFGIRVLTGRERHY